MPHGYNGKILHVDLTSRTFQVEEPPEAFFRTYWGGGGLASYYLLRDVPPGADPLGPENVLVFAVSVLTGAPLSGFSRYTVAAKSPLTGGFGEAEAGGYFGPELKFAGYEAVVVRGRAASPAYLWINRGQVEIRDARNVWGLENGPALDRIRAEVGQPKARAATIGPAGEKLALLANVMNECAHANGRCGLGAVMGAKNLKAVAVLGDPESFRPADGERLKELTAWHATRIREHGPNVNMSKMGTPMFVLGLNGSGILPTRNWRSGVFEGAEKIGWPSYEKILKRRGTCYRCAVACKRVVECPEPHRVDPRYGGPEYETLAAFGSICGVDDLAAVAKANEICNRFGLDTIGTGAAVAFAMECFERGLLSPGQAEGRRILFGDAAGMLWLVDRIARREGLGELLGQGVRRAAEKIGNGAERYAYTIKGQEIPFHDPRGKTAVGLGMAVSPTGADHVEVPHEVAFQGPGLGFIAPLGFVEPPVPLALNEAKVRYFKFGQATWAMNNTLGLCNFVVAPLFALTYDKLVEAVKAITGWETSLVELLAAGERSVVLARLFNNREGFTPADDRLFRIVHEPVAEGPAQGAVIDEAAFREHLALYYQMMGWDEQGRPTRANLHELNLGWAT